jgi:hypothetical protein
MIETELTFFEMQPERSAVETTELGQAHLGEAPEVPDAVDVRLALHELVAAMIHPVMLLAAQIHQAAVALPAIRINHAPQGHLALQNGRQHRPGTVRHDLRVNFPVALEQAEDRHFLKSSPAPFAPDAPATKITFVNLDLAAQGRLGLAEHGDALPEMPEVKVDRVAVQAGQLGNFSGFHIQTKQPQQEPKFPRRNARPPETPVSPCHHWLYTPFSWA